MIPAGWSVLTLLAGLGIGWGLRTISAVQDKDEAWDLGWKRGHAKGYQEGNNAGFSEALTAVEQLVGKPDTDVSRPHP